MYRILIACLFCFQALGAALDFSALDTPHIKVIDFTPEKAEWEPYLQGYIQCDPSYKKVFLEFHGFPTERPITLSIKRIISKDKWYPVEKICIRNTGMILIEGTPSGHLFFLSGRGFLLGERIHLRFATVEGDFCQEISLIPNPLIVRNHSKAVILEAELLDLEPALYAIRFPGVPEKEIVTVQALFGNYATAPCKHEAAEVLNFSPDAKDKPGGESELVVTRKHGQQFRLSLPWGTRFYHYIEKNKFYKT